MKIFNSCLDRCFKKNKKNEVKIIPKEKKSLKDESFKRSFYHSTDELNEKKTKNKYNHLFYSTTILEVLRGTNSTPPPNSPIKKIRSRKLENN